MTLPLPKPSNPLVDWHVKILNHDVWAAAVLSGRTIKTIDRLAAVPSSSSCAYTYIIMPADPQSGLQAPASEVKTSQTYTLESVPLSALVDVNEKESVHPYALHQLQSKSNHILFWNDWSWLCQCSAAVSSVSNKLFKVLASCKGHNITLRPERPLSTHFLYKLCTTLIDNEARY